MENECYACHLKTVQNLTNKFKLNKSESLHFLNEASLLLKKHHNDGNALIATFIHRLARNIICNINLYQQEKLEANLLLLNKYKQWHQLVKQSNNPKHKAAKLAVVGNIIDYGAHSVSNNIINQIELLLNKTIAIDESVQLFKKVSAAKSVLYLGDNAGEIVFDKLFIETLNHPNVTYAVRGKPVINDVTIEDTQLVGINKLCKIISNGYDAPSTLLEHCSSEFIETYENVDIIISKGQGNFEGLMNSNNDKIFFMLMAKCNPMAKMLGVKKGDLIIKQLKTNAYVI